MNRSRGHKHSEAIKRGIRRLRELPPTMTDQQLRFVNKRANCAAQKARIWHSMLALLGKINVPIPTPDDLEKQLRSSYRQGYIQALHDVRKEGWKQELVSYQESLLIASKQEARALSHAYDWKQ